MKSITQPLITLAQIHFAQNNLQAAAECLAAVLEMEPDNLLAHNLREKHDLPGCYGRWMGVKAEISSDDDIFKFFAAHPTSRNPLRDYLADGWRTMLELRSSEAAEFEIRRMAVAVLRVLQHEAPGFYADFEIFTAGDRAEAARISYHKV